MDRRFRNITLGLLVLSMAMLGSIQILNAQQDKSTTPNMSVVTLDITGMT